MKTQTDKIPEQQSNTAPKVQQEQSTGGMAAIEDHRPATIYQRKLRETMANSPRAQVHAPLRETMNASVAGNRNPIQRKANKTGLPDKLKSGIENLSGYAMDDVTVRYNSSKPTQLNAHAYAQGTDIHIASGQEKHLPHEAWHVVQQKQGRVKPTMQLKGHIDVNDDAELEKEADVMGARALKTKPTDHGTSTGKTTKASTAGDHPYGPITQSERQHHFSDEPQPLIKGSNTLALKMRNTQLMPRIVQRNGDDVAKAISTLTFLNEFTTTTIDPMAADETWRYVDILEGSDQAADYQELLTAIKKKLPDRVPLRSLQSRYIHAIWVSGDYTTNAEFIAGWKTRKGIGADTWQNCVWTYHPSLRNPTTIDGMAVRMEKFGETDYYTVDFKATMNLWAGKPNWVDGFLPILDILYQKNSFVAMSDIMRMIILYYKGGLYLDHKIQIQEPGTFFTNPQLRGTRLHTAPGGENWALAAEGGDAEIGQIMASSLADMPPEEVLNNLPQARNAQNKYSLAHAQIHDDKGPFHYMRKLQYEYKVSIETPNPGLDLHNPRPLNSWNNKDKKGLEHYIVPGYVRGHIYTGDNSLFSALSDLLPNGGTAAEIEGSIGKGKQNYNGLLQAASGHYGTSFIVHEVQGRDLRHYLVNSTTVTDPCTPAQYPNQALHLYKKGTHWAAVVEGPSDLELRFAALDL